MKTKILILLIAILSFPMIIFSQICVDLETLTQGTEYGNGFNSVGELVFTENNIPVTVEEFQYTGGGITFGNASVTDGSTGINSGNDMWVSNINFVFDFTGLDYLPNFLTFDFVDQGGNENLSVNGEPIFDGELFAANPAGVSFFVSNMGTFYRATIIGEVSSLLVGGQEFSLDNICVSEVEYSVYCVDFESLLMGTSFGNGINSQGDIIFSENEIPVSVEYFNYESGGGTFGTAQVTNSSGIGTGQDMMTSNINLGFDFSNLPFVPNYITFDFGDFGGHENLGINNNTVYAGELGNATVPGGINMTFSFNDNLGSVTLQGQIDHLLIGGQEFFLDNICAYLISDDDDPYPIAEEAIVLEQNFPNPFYSITNIPFELKSPGVVNISVFDLLGNEVCQLTSRKYETGMFTVQWNGTDKNGNFVPSGMYFYRVETDGYALCQRMNLVR